MEHITNEPLSPSGRLVVQPELTTIIHFALGLRDPVDITTLKSILKNSLAVNHPRFCSLLSLDENGRAYWVPTEINIDRHIIISNTTSSATYNEEQLVHDYIANLCLSTPLSTDRPLWEIHVLEKCLIFRIHHALGDGISLVSLLVAECGKVADPKEVTTLVTGGSQRDDKGGRVENKIRNWIENFIRFIKMLFLTLEFVSRCLWISDRKTVISGSDGVEMWPRKITSAKFLIEHMKTVKDAVGDATINDVLIGVISSGLSRYLDHRSPNSMKEGQRITGISMVNLREQSGLKDVREMLKKDSKCRWGNEIGTVLVPIYYQKSLIEPLEYVKNAKELTKMKRKGPVAFWSKKCRHLAMFLLGPKMASRLGYKLFCHNTFTISNIRGPEEEIMVAGNTITFIKLSIFGVPSALSMTMVSYAGKADMQIVVAKDIIPDPEFLAKCFEDSLLQMTESASNIL